ncbi:probable helicase senataxin isoform X1 [Tympanuchus pallidicinctus]|uniref:probable helicase senataxin isoform X1 n=2 Tax=Tympanuchus pallidicinctus TaxID=109042 RepID=UPI00228715BD|nr:probable helicase senataxin isoform X1 [Tympanuchus pallidicinctus]XP_052523434.1 probable helicase senataxin isoform X1 [Tympanuchus pallidicinctus]XP_052523435.1 probable helicase senataxin isoform X1 [Tympanuchus pallidicinctus]XP_052523436.1 probable helicase senataxin isoform X1 [Tympanuchus pallidicinctus]
MNVCRWCTPSGLDTTEYLKSYASKQLSPEDLEGSNDDLCYCLECVVEYHKARERLPSLHRVLLELETSRLIAHIEKSMREEAGEDDELFIVDENGETQLPVYVGPDFENNLRVPLIEMLKYPYLLLHEKVSELCVEVLCRMEESHTSFQIFEKYPGIYLFLVHPNEVIRRWAILTARNLGKVDRDDYYDLQEVLTCLFKVIELGLFESPDIYRSSVIEKGKLILLPSHLYDNTNYKNYWLGICMLLTVLEEQAMDSLLLGPDKQNDFMQSILHTMEKEADDDSTDPFWPALHCFMVILDQLGAKVWGQLIDPVQAFQTIINSVSYNNEIKNIRNSFIRAKSESKTNYDDEMVTCSQMVYTYNTEKPQKDTGWKTAICPDYCPNMYEDMQTLANVLQSDIGKDMRVHDSTFLWFIPFVQSLMDLKDLGVAYIVEVIHYLCSEIKDILNERIQRCDKVSEFFLLILVSIIELHRNKKCLHLLWISSQEWVEAVVRCAKLPAIAFTRCTEKAAGSYARGSSTVSSQASNSVQHACVQLIRSLLREGYQIGQHALCKQYLDKLNLLLRGNLSLGWQLNIQETQELQVCLKQVIRNLKSRAVNVSVSVESNANSAALPSVSLKQEKSTPGDKMSVHGRENLCSPVAFISKEGEDGRCQDNSFTGRNSSWEEDCTDSSKNSKSLTSTDCLLVNIKKEPKDLITQQCKCLQKSFAKEMHGKVQENRNSDLMSGNCDVGNQGFNTSIQSSNSRRSGVLENKQEAEAVSPMCLSAQTSVDSPEDVYSSDVKGRKVSPSSSSEFKEDTHRLVCLKMKMPNTEGHSRLLTPIVDLKNCGSAASASEAEQPVFCAGSSCMRKDCCKHQGVNAVGENEDRESANISRNSESTWEQSAFQYGLVSKIQERREMPLDCFSFAKNQPGMQGNKDNSILLANISDTVLQNVSTKDDSSLFLKSVHLKDQEQPNLRDLLKCDRKGQISKTSCTVKNSVSGHIPSSFENKGDMSNAALPVSPLPTKCESSERLIVCSKYFKRENNLEGNEEEHFVRMVSGDNTLTNSQLDKDLSKLSLAAYAKSVNFPSQSSQESSMHNNTCDVKRKVKSAVRSSNSAQSNVTLYDTDSHDNKTIIILDSSDEENNVTINKETKEINENTCPEKQPLSEMQHDVTHSKSESKMPNSPLPLEDCDSQYFEFETEVDVFSVWQDTQEYKQDGLATSVGSSHSDGLLKDHTNEWGYDTDYVSDDAVEKETNWTGEEINTSHQKENDNTEVTNSALQEFSAKENAKDEVENSTDKTTVDKDLILNADLTEPRASTSNISLASKLALKKGTLSPRKNIGKSKVARTIQRSPKAMALNTTQTKKLLQSTLKKIQPGRTMPAVVPPKKARQCPAPTSTVEKLGLKKAPRKAFELSQRSLDSVAELRSYGKVAGKVGGVQRGKLKRAAHPSLSTQINKKMLACQELQFLKQTRLSKSVRVKNISRSSEDRSKKASTMDTKSVKQKAKCLDKPSAEKQEEKKPGETFYPSVDESERITSISVEKEAVQATLVSSCSDSSRAKDCDVMIPPVLMDSSPCSAAVGDAKGKPEEGCIVQPEFGMATSKENECKPDENDDDDDDLFLTQLDPVDMELCSQDEDAVDSSIATTRTEEMEIDSTENLQQNEPLTVVKCKFKDCTGKVEKIGDCCSKHLAANSESDHLFAKPSLPPRKPSTTKIFSSVSSSRNAAFSKDLEDVEKQPQALKSRASVAKPAVLRPPSEKATPTGNQTCKTPGSINIPQPRISNNVLQPRNTHINNASNISRRPARAEHCSSFLGAQQHDHNIFVKEVLKWTYEMFANSMQFGPPNTLLQSVVASVPIRFQGYNDYFNTFFPLMMLNAFETLAQEWVENQKMKDRTYYFYLQNFCADLNTAEFIAYFEENDLTKQLHPKEDDLIFLVGQKKKDAFGEDSEVEEHLVNHVGLVRRFSRASGCLTRQIEQHIVCHLSVQTRGNLSFFINNQVKCVVVGSLVPTQRSFRGLLLLSRSPLAKPIINPSYSDFCPRDLPVASENAAFSMNEYNEDQKRAIETAYAMVKQHPGLAKICLIHGPPGTGKSKTIVGLLSRVLSENIRNEKTSKKNARMKQNRFLVCAPSNAAVDELMKKIIIAFKEKCQNKQEPLGNCGDVKLVRLGAERSINSEVRAFSLDKQVEHRMKRKPTDRDQDIQKKKAALDEKLDMLSRQRAMHRCEKRESQMLDDEIGRLSKERQQLASQLKEVRGHSQKVQTDIILESDIICCTLSTSGGGLLESAFWRQGPFSCVIVDEAGQSCEVETLIPLIHRCNKLVLVGDPRQLPPTIKSIKAQEYGYGQSLMARLQRHLEEQVQNNLLRRLPVVQLTVQYRMHPDICLFPSSYVYGRTLKTDKATEENRCSSEWPFQPYLVFDVGDGREERDKDSFSNPQEVKLVLEIIKTIKEKRKDLGLRRIGIITPYSAQKKKIQEELDRVFKNNSPGEVDTVDAFQGREKDCIIVTCVRAHSSKGSIGFLASLQRLNVTITRARFSLFILGRLKTLMENKDWNKLIQDAQRRGAIIKTSDKSYKKDALKILKLKPAPQNPLCQLPTKAGTTKAPLAEATSGRKVGEPANPREASRPRELAAGPGHAVPQGSRMSQQPQGTQVADSRRASISAPVEAAALPVDKEKPRDPRLASMASRTEAKGKEQDPKHSSQSAQSSRESTLQLRLDVSSAARDLISRTEPSRKHQQAKGQCEVPSTLPYAAKLEGDRRAPLPEHHSTASSERGQCSGSKWNKDPRTSMRRTSESSSVSIDSNSAKRRRTSH